LESAKDRNGNVVQVGTRVCLLCLSGNWLEELPLDEKAAVLSTIGEIFMIEEIDEHGHPWIRKSWPNERSGKYNEHSIALESREMEIVVEQSV